MKIRASALHSLLFLGLLDESIGSWASDVPWSNLNRTMKLLDSSPSDFVANCEPRIVTQGTIIDYYKNANPAACVLSTYMCGFENCNPYRNATLQERWDRLVLNTNPPDYTDSIMYYFTVLPELRKVDTFNIPSKILMPQSAGEIVQAVEFATTHGLELSVKTTGHSYQGASQKKDTLLINMYEYPKSSSLSGGIVECVDNESVAKRDGSTDGPCALVRANGKQAYIKVGGGENFAQAYLSIRAFNADEANSNDYMMLGGAWGGVSPMGWTMQGGMGGTTNGRAIGVGVDQVVQLEMVLPSGDHVRLSPSSWESSEQYLYPSITKVSGECRSNVDEDNELLWEWEPCAVADWSDLWFAVLGGGGGTFGIVTSMYHQLHEKLPIQQFDLTLKSFMRDDSECHISNMSFPPSETGPYDVWNNTYDSTEEHLYFSVLGRAYWKFILDFMVDPKALGLEEDVTTKCSSAFHFTDGIVVHCYGTGADGTPAIDPLVNAWKKYMDEQKANLMEDGIAEEHVAVARNCVDVEGVVTTEGMQDSIDILGGDDLLSVFIQGPYSRGISTANHLGNFNQDMHSFNVLLPKKWIIEHKDDAVALLLSPNTHSYFALGGKASIAHDDKSVSLSPAHRRAGWMMMFKYDYPSNFFSELFPQMFNTSTRDEFPGFIGSNHRTAYLKGPLKEDWTQHCPIDWTDEKRDALCISAEEAVYGTKLLAQLTAIKEKVDGNYLLDCNGCINNKRNPPSKQDSDSMQPSDSPSTQPSDSPLTQPSDSPLTQPSDSLSTQPSNAAPSATHLLLIPLCFLPIILSFV